MKVTKADFFKRQTTLLEIGKEGQQKLQNAKILVVGCGGLGSPVAVYLALSGVGEIHLIDFDTVDVTNLHRQVFYTLEDIGKSKSFVLANFIKQRAPFTNATFSTKSVTKEMVLALVSQFDIIVDGTDSLPTKYLLNDACVLKNKPLIYGSLYKFDGYVATFNVLQKDENYSTNLRDAFPKIATDIPNCSTIGTLNPIVGIIAMQQTNEVVKLITGVGKPLINQLLVYNSLRNSQLKMKLKSNISKKEIAIIFKNNLYFDASCEAQNKDWLITAKELKKRFSALEEPKLQIISVLNSRENHPFPIDKFTSLSAIKKNSFTLDATKEYVVVCQKGITSYDAVKHLKEKYPKRNILSLVDGIQNY